MTLSNFRNCCGTVELGGFPNEIFTAKEEISKTIKKFVASAAEITEDSYKRRNDWTMNIGNPLKSYTVTVATVTQEQMAAKTTLESIGFKPVEPEGFVNPKTGNTVWLMVAKTAEMIEKCKEPVVVKPVLPKPAPRKRVNRSVL